MGVGGSKVIEGTAEFNSELLNSIPSEIRNELEKYAESRENVIAELTETYEKLKVDSEQRIFEIEQQLLVTNEKFEKEVNTSSELRDKLTELEKKYNETANKVRELQTTQFEKDERCNALEQINRQLSSEKQELSNALDKKSQEVEQLTSEWKQMSERVAEASRKELDALTKLGEIESKNVTAEHKEERMRQELESVQRENTWLKSELAEKVNQLLSARKDQSGKVFELQAQLNEKSTEVEHLQQLVDSLRQCTEEQNTKMEDYIQKLKDARDFQDQMEEHYKTELQSQEKLTELYKTTSVAKEKQVDELVPAVQELQKLLKEAAAAQAALENEKEAEKQSWEAVVKERDEQIRQLEKELEDANELIEAMKKKGVLPPTEENIEALSPAAAAASRLLKSGMTLTQIYSEYVKTCEALQLKEEENKRLSEDLSQIMQEIEEKAPILMKQREDYEKSLETISCLTSQLDTAMAECEKLRLQHDEAQRIVKELTRENKRLRQTTSDLAQQVRLLLKELEEARGTVVSMTSGPDISSTDVSSTSQVISEHLVTFRSIEELQEQNQRLLAAIRELGEEKDKEESESAEDKIKELKVQLDKAMSEIEDMQRARERQAEMVESIVRQRDMYKLMLHQSSGSPVSITSPKFSSTMIQPSGSSHLPTTPGSVPQSPMDEPEKKTLEETSKALKELQEEFALYRREKSENEKILSEQVEKLREESSELRVLNAKLSSQLDFSLERFKVLQTNVASYKKEISLLREKSEKLAASNAKYEEVNANYRVELMATQEKLSHAETQCQCLRIEKDMLKSIEQRLLQEKESVYKDQRSRDLLMANLQSIQNNMERAEFEAKTKYQQKIEALEKENSILHRKLDTLHEENTRRQTDLEKQLSYTRNYLDKERAALEDAKEQLRMSTEEIKKIKDQLAAAENKLCSQKERESVQQSSPDAKEQEVKALRAQLSASQNQIQSLKGQLDNSLKQVEQYKSIAQNVEQSLEEQNKVSKELELRVTRQLEEAKQVEENLQQQILELKEANKILESENATFKAESIKIREENQMSHTEQQSHYDALRKELNEITEQRNEALRKLEATKEDLAQQLQLAKEAEENYKRELCLHAADVSELTAVKQELEGYTEKLNKINEDMKAAQRILETKEMSWSERETILKEDHAKLENRVKELQAQNNMLHEELEKMSDQLISLQKMTERNQEEQVALTQSVLQDGEQKSSDKLMEVIRFLRKEKDIAETKLDGSQAENLRLVQQLEYLKKQLDEATKTLTEMKQHEQASMQTAVQHAELLKKVETLNLLQDSNKMLREERDRAVEQITELENKVKELEEELNPLRETKKYLQSQYEALEVERNSLQAEVQRWKARTNHLIEQCNKSDPEEFKRMLQERDSTKMQLATANEEIHKLRAELSAANNQITQLQADLTSTKQEVAKLNEELTALKLSLESKEKEIREMGEKMIQLRKIGRKYRMQAEEVQRQVDELKASTALQQLEETHKAAISELENKLKKAEEELASITECLAVAESEKNNALKIVKEQEANVAKLMEELKTVNEALNKEKEESVKEKEATIKAREEILEHKKKYNKSCTVLAGAKEKLSSQKTEIDKLTGENKLLNEKVTTLEQKMIEFEAQASALKSHYEGRLGQLQRELDSRPLQSDTSVENTAEIDKLRKENAEIVQKLQQLQKLFEAHQKQAQPAAANKPKVSAAPVERPGSSADAVKTANIKPMTTPTTSSRPIQSAMVQPVRSTTTDSRIRASVQPMAVSTVTTAGTQATPTATVMPVSVQDSEMTQQMAPLSQMSPQHVQQQQQQVRPMQQVQPVSHVEEVPEQETVTVQEQEPAVVVSQSVSQPAGIHTQTTTTTVSTPPHTVTTPAVCSLTAAVSAAAQEVVAQSSVAQTTQADTVPTSQAPGTSIVSTKRPRDEGESSEEQTVFVKRTKTQSLVVAEVVPPATEEHELESQPPEKTGDYVEIASAEPSTQEVTQTRYSEEQTAAEVSTSQEASNTSTSLEVEPESVVETQSEEVSTYEEAEEEHEEVASEEGSSEEHLEDQDTRDSAMVEEEQGDAIVLTSDEEGNEYEGPMEEYDEEEDAEGMQEDDEEEEMEGAVDEPMGDEDDDADDVIVVDEDEEEPSPEEASMDPPTEEPHGSQSVSGHHPVSQATTVSRNIPQLSRVPSQTDRLIPAVRAQQLPPFTFGEGGSFEVGDDGIVPSTPTLLVPRRHDDFAEAVSSPQVQRRFVFGGSSEGSAQHSEFGRLETQGALGVDYIRMDLTQFDDASGSGRSVPVMPVTQTTPTISITEASPPREGSTTAEQEAVPQSEVQHTGQQSEDQEPTAMSPQCESSQDSTSQAEMPVEDTSQKSQPASEEQSGEGKQETDTTHDDKSGDKGTETATGETSEGKTDSSATGSSQKPRIQRIIWDKPGTSSSPSAQMSAAATAKTTIQRRLRGQGRGFRTQRPMHRTANIAEPQPASTSGTVQPLLAQRGRGTRGAKRGQFQGQAPF